MNKILPAAYSFIEDILQVLYIKRSQGGMAERVWFWNIADKDGYHISVLISLPNLIF